MLFSMAGVHGKQREENIFGNPRAFAQVSARRLEPTPLPVFLKKMHFAPLFDFLEYGDSLEMLKPVGGRYFVLCQSDESPI